MGGSKCGLGKVVAEGGFDDVFDAAWRSADAGPGFFQDIDVVGTILHGAAGTLVEAIPEAGGGCFEVFDAG